MSKGRSGGAEGAPRPKSGCGGRSSLARSGAVRDPDTRPGRRSQRCDGRTAAPDLRRARADLTTREPVLFDMLGTGAREPWTWVTPRAGLLVWDPAACGWIASGRQLFGSVTFWISWEHGYQPLALLDQDRDGWLRGPELSEVALWCDRNGNGFSEAGEVRPLGDHEIVALAVIPTGRIEGQWFVADGVELADGRRRSSYDWIAERVELPPGSIGGAAPKGGAPRH